MVWDICCQVRQWGEWQKNIEYVHAVENIKAGTDFDWKMNGVKMHSRLQTVIEEFELGWTTRSMGVQSIHTWQIHSHEEGVIVWVEECMEGWRVNWFIKKYQQQLEQSTVEWLHMLKNKCENAMNA